ncbi:MAG: DMT family transporter [Candidatus Eisenbacteria bacterium]|nr:DMT family transporter [Candidatus Eisenbacteria bacterium]
MRETDPGGGRQRLSGGPGGVAAFASLVGVAAVWGATFPLVRGAIEGVPTASFLLIRFLFAGALLLPFAIRRGGLAAVMHPRAASPGLCLALGYLLQTEGLRTTGPSVSAFLTATSVVIVPLLATILGWERAQARRFAAALLALAGVFLLAGGGMPTVWSSGETLTLLCAVAFAGQILLVAKIATPDSDSLSLAAGQIAYAAIALGAGAIARGGDPGVAGLDAEAWFAAGFTGLLATAAAFHVQAWAQRRISPGPVAICFATEPLFAAACSVLFYGDRLGVTAWLGAILVSCAVLLTLPVLRAASAAAGDPRRRAPRGRVD